MNYRYYYSSDKPKDDYGLKYVDQYGMGLKCNEFIVKYPPSIAIATYPTFPIKCIIGCIKPDKN